MRFLSVIRVDERSGQAPSEQLMRDMGQLIDELTRSGALVSTAGLRPTREGARVRLRKGGALSVTDGPFTETKEVIGGFARRFLRVHGDEWDLECEVRPFDGAEFCVDA
jgi:hypothetical protein